MPKPSILRTLMLIGTQSGENLNASDQFVLNGFRAGSDIAQYAIYPNSDTHRISSWIDMDIGRSAYVSSGEEGIEKRDDRTLASASDFFFESNRSNSYRTATASLWRCRRHWLQYTSLQRALDQVSFVYRSLSREVTLSRDLRMASSSLMSCELAKQMSV